MSYKVGPPFTIAKLVQITPMSLWFMIPITTVFMGFINQLTSLGGPTLYIYTHIHVLNYIYISVYLIYIYNWYKLYGFSPGFPSFSPLVFLRKDSLAGLRHGPDVWLKQRHGPAGAERAQRAMAWFRLLQIHRDNMG